MSKPLTILVVKIHSSLNAGDLALAECTVRQLKENFDTPKIIISTNYPEEEVFHHLGAEVVTSPSFIAGNHLGRSALTQTLIASFFWLVARTEARIPRLRLASHAWRSLIDAYSEADLVVGVSGNQFFSMGRRLGWPLPLTSMAIDLAHRFQKPYYSMPESIGPLRRSWERHVVHELYSRARLILVRDSNSIQLAGEIGIPLEKVHYFPDPAFDYLAAPRSEALAILNRFGYQPNVPSAGATIFNGFSSSLPHAQIDKYQEVMAAVLRRMAEKIGMQIFLFIQVRGPAQREDDGISTRRVLDLMGPVAARVSLVDEALSPGQLKACYGCMDFFIPSRLHSGIFALGMGVPCFFVGYLTKTAGVLKQLGLQDWMLPFDQLELEPLWSKIESGWNNRQTNAARLKELLPAVIADARLAGKCIAEDYYRNACLNMQMTHH